MKQQSSVPWQNNIISAVLSLGIFLLAFYMKFAVSSYVGIDLKFLILGAAAGLALCAILLPLKKTRILFIASLVLLTAWVIVPGGIVPTFSLAWGAVCLIASIPFTASLFARIPQKAGKEQ